MKACHSVPRIEHAARAMCRFHGLPENTKFEGRPMWESYVPEVTAIVAALDELAKVSDDTRVDHA